ncbi:ATP-binding protein [Glaciecola siphonariae]|uniref:histidine kinase n=1 Tax=Glaciecola siphonariae TaxID=521012 RepID=A0ABV9LSQ8_9ALTE
MMLKNKAVSCCYAPVLCAVLAWTLLFSCSLNAQNAYSEFSISPTILLVTNENGELPWNQKFKASFSDNLKARYPNAKVYNEYVDSINFSHPDYLDAKFAQLKLKYNKTHFDFAVIDGNGNANFEGHAFSLLPKTPKVIMRWDQTNALREDPLRKVFNVAPSYSQLIQSIVRTKAPSTIAIMHHALASNTLEDLDKVREDIGARRYSANIEYMPVTSIYEAQNKIKRLPENSVVVILPFQLSYGQNAAYPRDIVTQISNTSDVPIFVHWDTLITGKVVGGYVVSASKVAEQVALAGINVLNGRNLILQNRNIYEHVYNYKALEAFGISRTFLPNNSRVINKPDSAFSLFTNTYISLVVLVLFLVSVALLMLRWNRALSKHQAKLLASKASLQATNERFELATSAASLGIWEYELGSKAMYWNRWMYEHHQLASTSASYNFDTWLTLVHDDDRGELERTLVHAIGRKQAEVDIQYRVMSSSGDVRYLSLHAQVILDDKDLPDRLLGTLRDVTTQIEYRSMLETERKAAESATRAKTEFLAGMSHEIRTPMNGVIGAADLLGQSNLNAFQSKYAGIIKKSATGLLRILNDILDLSKIESNKLQIAKHPFDLEELLISTVAFYQAAAVEKGIKLQLLLNPEAKVWVSADSTRIKQVLQHLIDNAIKFTDLGDVDVIVSLTNISESKAVSRPRLKVEVRDTGAGIAPERQVQIFQRFVQTSSNHVSQIEGTGLGLTISSQLLSLMKGALTLESQLNVGSSFFVSLPIDVLDFRSAQGYEFNQSGLAQMVGKTILVVDDNEINHEILSHMLMPTKANILVAESGRQAIDMVKTHHVDIIFMDIVMPEMDGFEASKRIRELLAQQGEAQCTIVSISANSEYDINRSDAAADFDYILTKPLRQPEIMGVLSDASRRIAATSEKSEPQGAKPV